MENKRFRQYDFNMLPKEIPILGEKYKLIFIKDLRDDDGNLLCGMAMLHLKEIHLCAGMSYESTMATLNHEMIHVVINTVGADQTIPHNMVEVLCESIGNHFQRFYSSLYENLY